MAQTSTIQSLAINDFARDDEEFMQAQYQWLNEQMQGTAHEPILLSDFDDTMVQPPPDRATHNAGASFTAEIVPATVDSCLHRTLEIFPDIARSYVRQLWEDETFIAAADGEERYSAILEHITSQTTYPKEKDKQKEKTDLAKTITLKTRDKPPWEYIHVGIYLLAKEFPEVSTSCIKSTLNSGALRIADAFSRLASKRAQGTLPQQKKGKLRKKALSTSPPKLLEEDVLGPWLEYATTEFNTARKQHAEKESESAKAAAELLNEEEARASGAVAECGCCFTDTPLNRTITCASETPHHFCFECVTSLVKNEIGSRKCRPVCMDTSGCAATFAESQLRLCLTEKMLGHLLRLQQQEDIKAAGIDGLEECPFCDYMAVLAPKEVDREFVCGNPDCGQTSCRLCSTPTHVPKTCAEAKADDKLNARHTVEEAMTEALVRVCNTVGCATRFVKLDGCNKMTCHKCGAFQCYLCKQTIKGYEHFGTGPGKCPQAQDDAALEVLYAAQVKKAEDETRAKVQAETGIAGEDLTIEVSERVKKDEENARRGMHAGLPGHGLPPGFAAMRQAQEEDARRIQQQIADGRRQLNARPQALRGAEFDNFYGPPHMAGIHVPAAIVPMYGPIQAGVPGQAGVPQNLYNPANFYAHAQPPLFPGLGNYNYGQYMAQPPQAPQVPQAPHPPANPFAANPNPAVAFPGFGGPAAGLYRQPVQAQHNPVPRAPAAADALRRHNHNQTLVRLRREREHRAAQLAAQMAMARRRAPRTPHAGGTNADQQAADNAATAAQPDPLNIHRAYLTRPQHNLDRPVHWRQADEFFDLTDVDQAFTEDPFSLFIDTTLDGFDGDAHILPGQGNQAVRWQDFNMVQPGHVSQGFAEQDHALANRVEAGPATAEEPCGGIPAIRRGRKQAEPIEID